MRLKPRRDLLTQPSAHLIFKGWHGLSLIHFTGLPPSVAPALCFGFAVDGGGGVFENASHNLGITVSAWAGRDGSLDIFVRGPMPFCASEGSRIAFWSSICRVVFATAAVAELVDAADLKSASRKGVGVRVPPAARPGHQRVTGSPARLQFLLDPLGCPYRAGFLSTGDTGTTLSLDWLLLPWPANVDSSLGTVLQRH